MGSPNPDLAIIVPVLNERDELPALLAHLRHWQARGARIVLVDGGSKDDTPERARQAGFEVLEASRGRASQMNAGARSCQNGHLLFLHADTRLPPDADQAIHQALAPHARAWGRFNVTIDGRSALLPLIAFMMNQRSKLTGIATGDQAIFITRALFDEVGGFPAQPLMEDIEFSRRLKRLCRPTCLRQRVTTSGRRWDSRGSWRTIVLMWHLRWLYWRGANPEQLAERYR